MDSTQGRATDPRTELEGLRTALSNGEASDGYHTHRELYEYRMLYNAHAALGWLAAGIPVVKSRKHSDGELCFGGGWFIVTAQLPTGQVSNHYRDEHWDLFNVPAVELPPEYDGHTPADAAIRLREAAAALREPRAPTVEPPAWLYRYRHRGDSWSEWIATTALKPIAPQQVEMGFERESAALYRGAPPPPERVILHRGGSELHGEAYEAWRYPDGSRERDGAA